MMDGISARDRNALMTLWGYEFFQMVVHEAVDIFETEPNLTTLLAVAIKLTRDEAEQQPCYCRDKGLKNET